MERKTSPKPDQEKARQQVFANRSKSREKRLNVQSTDPTTKGASDEGREGQENTPGRTSGGGAGKSKQMTSAQQFADSLPAAPPGTKRIAMLHILGSEVVGLNVVNTDKYKRPAGRSKEYLSRQAADEKRQSTGETAA